MDLVAQNLSLKQMVKELTTERFTIGVYNTPGSKKVKIQT